MAKKRKKNSFFKALLSIVSILIFAAISLSIVGAGLICLTTKPVDTSILDIKMSSSIYYEDESGEQIIIQNLYSDENRSWADFEEIPINLKNAFVAIEDERFFSHPGFDIKRTGSAAINTIMRLFDENRSVYGGSTITQQLVKNLTKEDERSILRKFKEIYRAIRLENDLSKNEILELYLNTIYLSQSCNGVGAAAKVYFAKDLDELTLAECASIAGITQFPSRYDPYLNPEANREKRITVLSKMLELNMISSEEYNTAVNEELTFRRAEGFDSSYYSYFVDTVIEEVLHDLTEEHNYSPVMAQNLLYTGGLQIKCTIDPEIQDMLEQVYKNEANFVYKNNELMQSAMVITEASTGEVKAVVGGMGDKGGSRTFNRATSARQPGSSIKPIAVYAPALDYGIINGASVLQDVPTTFHLSGGGTWTPRNSSGSFSGSVSLRTAIARSLNVPAAQLVEKLGVQKSYDFLSRNMGITTLVDRRETDYGIVSDKALAALSLGGLTDGISPFEMTGAYATFINDGIYIKPHTYTEIYDYNGNLLFSKNTNEHRAMKSSTATLMTNLLTSVVTGGTGTSAYFSGPELAGKTGTAERNHDKWFVGFTPSLVGAVWVGYDTPTAINSYGNPAARLWKEAMSQIDYTSEPMKFSEVLSYDSLKRYSLCSVSGLLATEFCESEGTVYSVMVDENSSTHLRRCDESKHETEDDEPEDSPLPDHPSYDYDPMYPSSETTSPEEIIVPEAEATEESPSFTVTITEVPTTETVTPPPENSTPAIINEF